MFARAWSITARFFLLFTFAGSTVFLENEASRGGTSGGLGAFADLCPMDASFPVRKRCTACRVRSTWESIAISVVLSTKKNRGNLQCWVWGVQNQHCPLHKCGRSIRLRNDRVLFPEFMWLALRKNIGRCGWWWVGKFCRSSTAFKKPYNTQGITENSPSETGRNSTTRQSLPFSGVSINTFSNPSLESSLTSTEYVHAVSPVSLFPVLRSKSYLESLSFDQPCHKINKEQTYAMDKLQQRPSRTPLYLHATNPPQGVDNWLP